MAVPPSAIKKLKTNTRDYTQTAVIVLIKYGVFRAQDIDDAIAAVNSKNTWIAPTNLPDYDDSIENDIVIGKQNPKIIKIRNIIAAHYDINLEEELIEEPQELVENTSEREVNDEKNKKSSPSALVVSNISKKQVSEDDLVVEEIDERILRILGLEDVFDIDYETYISLLKEKLISSRMTDSKLSAEEDELIRGEFKRVKGKVGRFKPKRKTKIDVSNLTGISLLKPADKKQSGEESSAEEKKPTSIFDGILNILKSITGTVDNIYGAISLNNSLLNNQLEFDRRESERLRRGEEEGRLETKKDGFLEKAKKILAPVESIFDRILKFLLFTLLGRAFKLFMDWASDPENGKKLESIGRFLKDWWPALLAAWFAFTHPLGKFIRFISGTIIKLTWKLAKFAIPKLLSFIKANPRAATAAAAAGLFTAGLTIPALFPSTVDEQENKIKNAPGTDEDKLQSLRNQRQNLNFFDKLQGKGSEIDEQINFLETGETKKYGFNSGGIIPSLINGVSNSSPFSGIVDKDTGETVSGAGPDTQFLPIEDGGGAVLQRGEVVLQKGARERMIQQAGIDPLAFNVGSNANKPRKINSNILGASLGGLVGLHGGGMVGRPDGGSPSMSLSGGNFNIQSGRRIPYGGRGSKKKTNPRAQYDMGALRNLSSAKNQPGGNDAMKQRFSLYERTGKPLLNSSFGMGSSKGVFQYFNPSIHNFAGGSPQYFNPSIHNFAGGSPQYFNPSIHNFAGGSPQYFNPSIHNFAGGSPQYFNPSIHNFAGGSPQYFNPSIHNFAGGSPQYFNPSIHNFAGGSPQYFNPSIHNFAGGSPQYFNPSIHNSYNMGINSPQSIKQSLFDLRSMRSRSLERQGRNNEASILNRYNISPTSNINNIIKENTGLPNKGSSTDRRLLPVFNPNFSGFNALQPGEVVINKDAVNYHGGVNIINKLNSTNNNGIKLIDDKKYNFQFESNAKKPNITPPSKSGGMVPITMPPIRQSSGGIAPTQKAKGSVVPPFSAISPVGLSVRVNNADIYGIMG
jgi:hypothetical protein